MQSYFLKKWVKKCPILTKSENKEWNRGQEKKRKWILFETTYVQNRN